MKFRPTTWNELATALQSATQNGRPIGSIDLGLLNQIRRYAPEDLTVTVEAGLTLDSLQTALRAHGQWLPIDPPAAGHLTLAEILDRNLSGPRRHGHGTIREHLLGVRVALADGRIIRSGGEVVKNVAGYDLMKLFVGAEQSLGVIVEAAFKLLPLPQSEVFVQQPCASWEQVEQRIDQVFNSPVTPVVFDLHNLDAAPGTTAVLLLGFAGSRAETDWQLATVEPLGFATRTSLDYAMTFAEHATRRSSQKISVLPSRLVETLRTLAPESFVARAGNGIIEFIGPAQANDFPATPGANRSPSPLPVTLIQRVKQTYDPAGILPAPPGLALA
jgi:glycolate oxidase FAD binding subunit